MLLSKPLGTDLLTAADALFLSSRLDALPEAAGTGIEQGGRVVYFAGTTRLDPLRQAHPEHLLKVEAGYCEAAARTLLELPQKATPETGFAPALCPGPGLFARLRTALAARLAEQRSFALGPCEIDLPILFTKSLADRLRWYGSE